jgi:hypothetical protein
MRRYVHFDANFRLVLSKHDKRNSSDQALWNVDGFFANPGQYQEYLASADTTQQEASTTVRFMTNPLISNSDLIAPLIGL